jgi:hypothetical protein
LLTLSPLELINAAEGTREVTELTTTTNVTQGQAVPYNYLGRKFEGRFFPATKSCDAPSSRSLAVLLIPGEAGVTPAEWERGSAIAAKGWSVFIPDIYGATPSPELARTFAKDRLLLRVRLRAGLERLERILGQKPSALAVVGNGNWATMAAFELWAAGAPVDLVVGVDVTEALIPELPKPPANKTGAGAKGARLALATRVERNTDPTPRLAALGAHLRGSGLDWRLQIRGDGGPMSFAQDVNEILSSAVDHPKPSR